MKQRFNQIKEFEALLYESGTTILKFFLHISKNERKERLSWTSQRGSGCDAVPPLFLYLGDGMWRLSRSSVGSSSCAPTITVSFFCNHFASIRRSKILNWWVCFMPLSQCTGN
jgi:hypothetical protein